MYYFSIISVRWHHVRRVWKVNDELLYTVRSLVIVRNRLPAQVVRMDSVIWNIFLSLSFSVMELLNFTILSLGTYFEFNYYFNFPSFDLFEISRWVHNFCFRQILLRIILEYVFFQLRNNFNHCSNELLWNTRRFQRNFTGSFL